MKLEGRKVRALFLSTLLALSFFLRGSALVLLPLTVARGEAAMATAAEVNNRGVEQFKRGEFLDALVDFMTSSQMDKTLWKYHYNCAVVLLSAGNIEEARDHLDQSKRIDPGNPEMRRYHAPLMREIEGRG